MGGALIAITAGVLILRQNPSLAYQVSGATKPTPEPTPDGIDPYQMKFADLDSDLATKNGAIFEHYALYYLISIDQNTSGMLRRIKTDALHPELRDYATQMMSTRDQEVTQMFAWQKAWGYTHH